MRIVVLTLLYMHSAKIKGIIYTLCEIQYGPILLLVFESLSLNESSTHFSPSSLSSPRLYRDANTVYPAQEKKKRKRMREGRERESIRNKRGREEKRKGGLGRREGGIRNRGESGRGWIDSFFPFSTSFSPTPPCSRRGGREEVKRPCRLAEILQQSAQSLDQPFPLHEC